MKALQELKQTYSPAIAEWDSLSRDRRRAILHTFIERIIANPIEKHVIEFVVHWRDNSSNSVLLGHKGTRWTGWLPNDTADLLALVDAGALQIEIAARFPTRTWHAISNKVWAERGKGALQLSPLPVHDRETYRDFLRRTGNETTAYKARGGEKWNQKHLDKLQQMVMGGASQVEIAAAFPHRNWARLRATITKVCGNTVSIPGAGVNGAAGEIRKTETYAMYLARKHGKKQTEASDDDQPSLGEDALACVNSQDHCWTKRRSIISTRLKCCASRLKTRS